MNLAVSRRTTRRYHLFTPDKRGEMADIFWYSLAYALDKCPGITLFAACLMSTHPHYNIGDSNAEAPKLYEAFHRALALATKAFRGWPEEVFNRASTAAHEVLTPEAMVRALAYTIANPVAAFAVRKASDWPGATIRPEDIGTLELQVQRPRHYFRGPQFKDEYTIRFQMPPCLLERYGSLEAAQKAIAEAVQQLEAKAHAEAKAHHYFFKGPHRVLTMKHTKQASSYEVFGSLNPQFAAGGVVEAAKRAVAKIRAFRLRYAAAWKAYKEGDLDAVFPFGTWCMRVRYHCAVEPPPSTQVAA
ncbi:MAG: hypothetical protein AAGF12_02505 [Myxococcota bacterium]